MKNKETLEEVNWNVLGTKSDTFYNGAKWQQKQDKKMYSEEDMIAFGNKMQLVSDVDFDGNVKFAFDPNESIKQFKKK
jgi:hypothetical protein